MKKETLKRMTRRVAWLLALALVLGATGRARAAAPTATATWDTDQIKAYANDKVTAKEDNGYELLLNGNTVDANGVITIGANPIKFNIPEADQSSDGISIAFKYSGAVAPVGATNTLVATYMVCGNVEHELFASVTNATLNPTGYYDDKKGVYSYSAPALSISGGYAVFSCKNSGGGARLYTGTALSTVDGGTSGLKWSSTPFTNTVVAIGGPTGSRSATGDNAVWTGLKIEKIAFLKDTYGDKATFKDFSFDSDVASIYSATITEANKAFSDISWDDGKTMTDATAAGCTITLTIEDGASVILPGTLAASAVTANGGSLKVAASENAQTITASLAGSSSLEIADGATVTIQGVNINKKIENSGNLTIDNAFAGSIDNNTTGTITFKNATVTANASVTNNGKFILDGTSIGVAVGGSGTVEIGNDEGSAVSGGFSGALSASSIAIKSGATLNLTGTTTVSGGISNSGTLNLGGTLTGSVTGSGTIALSGGLTFATGTSSYAVACAVSGANAITKTGDGTMTLAGSVANTGATTISAGTFELTAAHTGAEAYSVADGAKLKLGAGGSLSTTALTLSANAALQYASLDTATAPIAASGAVTAASSIRVFLDADAQAALADGHKLLTWGDGQTAPSADNFSFVDSAVDASWTFAVDGNSLVVRKVAVTVGEPEVAYYADYKKADVTATVTEGGASGVTYALTINGTAVGSAVSAENGKVTFEKVDTSSLALGEATFAVVASYNEATVGTGSATATKGDAAAWFAEDAASKGTDGTWKSAVAYDATTAYATIEEGNTFTPNAASVGEVVTVTTVMKFGGANTEAIDGIGSAQAAVRVKDDSTYQVLVGGAWQDDASGAEPDTASEQTVVFTLDYAARTYTVAVGGKALSCNGSENLALGGGKSAVSEVAFVGSGLVKSIVGRFVSAGIAVGVELDSTAGNVVVGQDWIGRYMGDMKATAAKTALDPASADKTKNGYNYFISYALGLDPTKEAGEAPLIEAVTSGSGVTFAVGGVSVPAGVTVKATLTGSTDGETYKPVGTDAIEIVGNADGGTATGSLTLDPSTQTDAVKYYKLNLAIGATEE